MKKFILSSAIFLGACTSSNPGADYLGAWQSTSQPSDMILIEENGKSFIINRHKTVLFDSRYHGVEKMPFTLENGILSNGMIKVSYIKSSDTLTNGSSEYKRIDESVFNSVAKEQKP